MSQPRKVGRLTVTKVFDSYWRFACERQRVFEKRVQGAPPPWTADPIIASNRFTNVYRASDRVSQYLIRHVAYEGDQDARELFFRIILFKIFNRIDTWSLMADAFGEIRWDDFDLRRYERVLDKAMEAGQSIYSPAYIMPSPAFGAQRKHANHLRLLRAMMRDGLPEKIQSAKSLRSVYELLLAYPSMGPFLAFQLAIDLNYSNLIKFDEMDFVVAGPGARDGMRKCFSDTDGMDDADVIRCVADMAPKEFARLGLDFQGLWGRSLKLIDCQNLFCEIDKYARVAHPDVGGLTGRTRIKRRFHAAPRSVPQWYPPKWELTLPTSTARAA